LQAEQRVLAGPKVPEVISRGEAEEVCGGEGGPQSDPLLRVGRLTSHLQAEGSRLVSGGIGLSFVARV
jgi:hypothetical protein